LLEQQRLRLIIGAQPPLFHDHLDFLCELLGVESQVAHAIGFELHHLGQLLFRHLLKIRGVVTAGESVVTPAGSSDAAVELTRPGAWRSLEHHVFEYVRHAGAAVRLVHAAGAVPDHMRNRGSAPILLDDDPQAVRQLLLIGVGQHRCGCGSYQQHRINRA
jgi:hypothetical protein